MARTRTTGPPARVVLTVVAFRADRRPLPWWRRLLSRLRYGDGRRRASAAPPRIVDAVRRVQGG